MSFSDLVKKANKEKEEEKKKQSSFGTLVEKANSGKSNVTSKVSGSQVSNWGKSAQGVLKRAYNFLSEDGYRSADTSLIEEMDGYMSEANDVLQYLRANKNSISDYEKVYASYVDLNNALGSYQKDVNRKNDYLSQFSNEEEYQSYKDFVVRQEELKKMAESEQGVTGWQKYLDDTAKAEESKKQAREDEKWWETLGRYLGPTGPADTTLAPVSTAQLVDDVSKDTSLGKPKDDWTEEQKRIYGYLYATDRSKATQYAHETNEYNNLVAEEEALKKIAELATSNFWAGAGNTIGAIATAPLGLADYLADLVQMNATGTITTDGNISPFEYSQAVTSGISSHLNEKYGTLDDDTFLLGGKGLGDVYGLGTSIAQSMASAYALGPGVTLISYFGQGAASGVDEALSRGATEEQAILYGTALGAFEAVAEEIGVEKLFSLGASATFKGFLKNILSQAGAEGMEEGLTALLSNIADNAIMQDKSNFNFLVAQYMASGMSESEAKKKAWLDSVEGIAFDTIAGAVSGGISGGVHTTANSIASNIDAKKIYGDGADLVTEALDIDPNNAYAQQMQAKVEQGKSLSGGQINRLVETNEQTLRTQDAAKMKSAVEGRLTQLGETGDISRLADVIVKAQSGGKLTTAERNVLVNSKYGRRVSTELNPQSIKSGEYSSAWAENIGTERINAEAYNKQLYDLAVEKSGGAVGEKNVSVTESTPIDKIATEGKLEVSADGKTKIGDTEVSIKEIASIKDGEMMLRLEDGSTVNATDVEYGSSAEALLYENVVDLGLNAETANAFVRGYSQSEGLTAQEYVLGFREAYRYGEYGYPVQEMSGNGFSARLSEAQKGLAYNLGKTDAKYKVAEKQSQKAKIASTVTINADKNANKGKKKGKVHYDVDTKALTDRQKTSLKGLETIADALGVEFYLFESEVGADGKRKGANGWFDPKDGSIHIDIHAGLNGEGTMLFTAAHELTHFIREWSPAKFKVFADFLLEQYGQKGISVDALVRNQMEKAKRNGRDISFDTAYEEVVADSCESMLADGDIVQKLAELKAKDKTLWAKIKDFIADLVAKIKAVYEGLSPDSVEGRYVAEMLDSAEKLKALWTEALVDAGENFSSAEQTLAENGIAVNSATDSASLYSVRDVLTDEQRQKVASALATRFDVTPKEAMDWLKAETSMASLILNPKYSQYLDYTADPNEVAIKQNSDYPQGTVDFSPICAKRREFTSVMNNILRVFPNHVFAATDLAKIRSIMQEEGMTIPCGICYVEDRRQLDTIVAQNFIDSLKLYREGSKTRPDGKAFNTNQLKGLSLTDGDAYTPSVYELVSLEGLNVLKAKNPNMAEAWVKFNNARGMQSVRLLANEAEYKRQILKYSKQTVKSKNDKGGLRVYSFSDAEMFHLIDIIQVITDSATVGLSLQGYTKVNEYARTVKDTGEKLNRSLIPKGELGYHLENGKVVLDYDTVEGIDINHPDFFDNKDNPDVGNITIGVSDVQIRAAMVSDFVDQIIPFHTGQSEEVLGEKGIATWSNYKDFQTEKDIATGKVSDHQINIYTEVLQVLEKEGKPITKRTFVEKFLQVCKENNLIPRFSQFLNTNEKGEYVYNEGYHKMLVDFKTFAQTEVGEYLPQKPVKPIFDNEYITKILKDYVKSQKVKDADLAKSMPRVIERITNEIVKPGETKLSDRDSEGNTLTKEQQEFFKDSKVRDADGNLMVMYHGTNTPNFTVFDPSFSDDKTSLFFTDSPSVADSYTTVQNGGRNIDPYRLPNTVKTVEEYNQYMEDNGLEYRIVKVTDELIAKATNDIEELVRQDKHNDYHRSRISELKRLKGKYINYNGGVFYITRDDVAYNTGEEAVKAVVEDKYWVTHKFGNRYSVYLNMKNPYILDSGKTYKGIGKLEIKNGLEDTVARFTINDEDFKVTRGYRESYEDFAKRFLAPKEVEKFLRKIESEREKFIQEEMEVEGSTREEVIAFWERYGGVETGEFTYKVDNASINYTEPGHWKHLEYEGNAGNTRALSKWAKDNGHDGVIIKNLRDIGGYSGGTVNKAATIVIAFDSNQVKATSNKNPTSDPDIRYSDRTSYAPTFYSHMGKVVDGIKSEKVGAGGVVSYLKGKGVKNEEIKWSGIEAFLEGKKSVTKAELQEFIAGSQLVIEEEMSGLNQEAYDELNALWEQHMGVPLSETFSDDFDLPLTEENVRESLLWAKKEGYDVPPEEVQRHMIDLAKKAGNEGRWARYKLGGGTHYRELVFKMPNSSYSNDAMRAHWGGDAEGVLAHARIQDMTTADGKKMLFVEEIQSDWHNEGRQTGYDDNELFEKQKALKQKAHETFLKLEDYSVAATGLAGEWETIERTPRGAKLLREYREAQAELKKVSDAYIRAIPDAPFRSNYHEYVLKRLIRMAAEEGYDSIGWTTADIQSQRWSEDYAEGYRIEYDQDIPSFLKKYGKKWGAKVGNSYVNPVEDSKDLIAELKKDIEGYKQQIEEIGESASENEYVDFLTVGIADMQATIERLRGTKVWSMSIPDSMKNSVLHEGQVLYSDRVTDKKTLDFLNDQIERGEYITVYRSFQVIDGGLYAPMNAVDRDENGKNHKLGYRSEIGKWEMATESRAIAQRYMDTHPDAPYAKFDLDGVDNKTGGVAYNPYLHASNLVLNDQFSAAYRRNLVTVECRVPLSEADGAYKADYAKDGTGWAEWKSGKIATQLKKKKPGLDRKLFLSRYMLPYRILSDAEVASMYKEYLDGTDVPVPWNVVTPSLRKELEKAGVNISYADVKQSNGSLKFAEKFPEEAAKVRFSDRDPDSVSNRSLLANALESVAQNDVERSKLAQYKEKIALIESEQAKLTETRAKIKELSFAKGKRDVETIKQLQFEANQSANRINTYDRQLLNLESTKALKGVLEREKQMAYKKAEREGKEALAKYRERAAETQRELLTRYQESRAKGVEGRRKTEMRHKIKNVVNELNQYLLRGTKEKHVPIELQKAVAEALEAVNMDTVGAEERIAKLEAELVKAKTPEAIQEISRKIDHIREMGERMDGKLQKLKDAYDDIVNSNDPLVANSHDEVISNSIARVIKEVGSTPLRDMTLSQLEDVYDMYRMVLTTIRNTNKAFKAKKNEEISVIANRVMEEIDKVGKKKLYRTKAEQFVSQFDWNNLKPVYAFERIGSDTFTEVFNNVRAGEDTWAVDITEAKEFSKEQRKKHRYDSWDFKKRFTFTSTSGMQFELSLDQIMSLYAYSKREQAKDHLKKGGIVFDETTEVTVKTKLGIPVKFNPTQATAYNLSDETLADIISKLTTEQRAFVDVMQEYLSTTMGEKGNEVSLELYGVKLFKEKFYFPLKSATQFMAKAKEQQQGEVKVKNSGFSKETTPKASNPIVLTPFMDVWAGHVNEMSMYHAFVLPLEDFYRVFNYKTPTSDTMATESVEMFLQNAYGKAASQYIDQLLKDLNGGARIDPTAGIINKLTGLFKKSAVFASASVVVQQPSAIARATALVDTKYFVGNPLKGKHSEVWAEVKKYAPVAIIKDMGYFDTGMGQSTVEWIKDEKTWKDKVDDIASKAPALADEYAWCVIWNAVKRETLHTHKDLKPNSEEFLKAVGERFTEVIVKTQVYDSVLSRSANMRSKDTGMKMATAFMGEPTTSLNMLENALIQAKRGDKVGARKAVGAVVASMILNSILVSIVYAGRDDDEDKTYAEKYIGTLTEELLDSFNPLTLIPFVKDIVSIVQGYDVERSDMAVITDLVKAWKNLGNDNRTAYRKVEDFAGAIASIFGLPVKNVMRDVRGMYNTVNSFINGEKTTGEGIINAITEGVTGKKKSNGQQLYEAILSGDTTQIERVKGRFKDQNAITSAIRTALRENDTRIKEAAVARYNGNIAEYMKIAKQIIAEGHFKQDDIVAAINSEINALKKGDGTSSSTSSDSNKVTSIYKMDDYFTALVSSDQATAYAVREDIIKTDVANGKDRDEAESDFNGRFASHLRERYEAGEVSDNEARNMLVEYAGKTEDEAYSKVQYWDFKTQYPDYDMSEESVKKYYADVEPSGISVDVYYDYTKQRAKCKGTDANGDGKTDSGSVKAEVLYVIDSLPITYEQKDVLYYLNGWSASTIWEAPWH